MVHTLSHSSITFVSDLDAPFQLGSTSGVLHGNKKSTDDSIGFHITTIFVWVSRYVHVDSTVDHLCDQFGYDKESFVFVPYSNKENWIKNYSYAIPSMECDSQGNVIPFGGTAIPAVFWNTDYDEFNYEELRTLTSFDVTLHRREKVAQHFSRGELGVFDYPNWGVPSNFTRDSAVIKEHPYLRDGESVEGSRSRFSTKKTYFYTKYNRNEKIPEDATWLVVVDVMLLDSGVNVLISDPSILGIELFGEKTYVDDSAWVKLGTSLRWIIVHDSSIYISNSVFRALYYGVHDVDEYDSDSYTGPKALDNLSKLVGVVYVRELEEAETHYATRQMASFFSRNQSITQWVCSFLDGFNRQRSKFAEYLPCETAKSVDFLERGFGYYLSDVVDVIKSFAEVKSTYLYNNYAVRHNMHLGIKRHVSGKFRPYDPDWHINVDPDDFDNMNNQSGQVYWFFNKLNGRHGISPSSYSHNCLAHEIPVNHWLHNIWANFRDTELRRPQDSVSVSINRSHDYTYFHYLCHNLTDRSKEQLLTAILHENSSFLSEMVLPDDDGTRRQFVRQLVMNDWFVRLFEEIRQEEASSECSSLFSSTMSDE